MPDDSDGYIDIELDEDDATGATPPVLDISFDEPSATPAAAAPPPRARRPAGAAAPPSAEEPALPMIAAGVCPRCGYALRPLEDVCPRCHNRVSEPVEKSVEKPSAAPPIHPEEALPSVESPHSSPHRGNTLFTIAGIILFLTVAVGIPIYMWMQPAQRAKREYRAGLQAQLAGNFDLARQHYQTALQLDPQFGLAAFSMGTTFLRIGDPAIVQSIDQITQSAIQGHTQELDEADRWFQQAATIGQGLPPTTRLMDQRISSPARLRAFARACLAVTAMIRASAALQADKLEDGMAWLQVAAQQAQAAAVDDPNNQTANQVLRAAGSMGAPQVSP